MSGKWALDRKAVLFVVAVSTVVYAAPAAATGNPVAGPAGSFAASLADGTGPRLDIAQIGVIEAVPYRWSAEKSADGAIIISGFAPSAEVRSRLLAIAGKRALDASSIALGAPEGFAEDTWRAMAILLALDDGRVELAGTEWRLTGTTRSTIAARHVARLMVDAGIEDKGWTIDLSLPEAEAAVPEIVDSPAQTAASVEIVTEAEPAPLVSEASEAEVAPVSPIAMPFGFAVRKLEAGWLVGGNAPIAAFQTYLEHHFHVETKGELVVAPAPEGFAAMALKGLEALDELQSGRLLFDNGRWTIAGLIADADRAEALRVALAEAGIAAAIDAVPVAASVAEPPPPPPLAPLPLADPYLWSAMRADDGAVTFAGFVPAESLYRYLDVRAGDGGSNRTALASGAPDGFAGDVLSALTALEALAQGEARFDGAAWSLSGKAADAPAEARALAGLGVRADAWRLAIALPEPPPPLADPYLWSVTRAENGALAFDGFVPVEALQLYLDVRAGAGGSNRTSLATGAPDGFARDVVAALAALDSLTQGEARFDGAAWSLSGQAADEPARAHALAGLDTQADAWSVAIDVPPPPLPPVERGAPDYVFSAEKRADGGIVLSGNVPAEATRAFLALFAGSGPAAALAVRDGAPQDFVDDVVAGLRALARMDTGRLDYADFAWRFAGKSAAAPVRDAVGAELAALSGPPDWSIDITGPTPLEVCAVETAAFDARNAILFDAGSARITRDSLPALDEIALVLKTCPETNVIVEGHTDSDGDDESNLILSVARAEAVVDRLVELGIGERRLYAIGYGESVPVVANETQDGKRRNRRIVLSVSEGTEVLGQLDR
ncbi:MAG: OmpA family protein [Alphaproteobacteria bacterium]|nr:OmpA family protein [Alphaproteobacteria bacterium]